MTLAQLIARLTDSEPPEIAPAPRILHRVCSWCTPQPELDRLNRTFPGQISHTLCPTCAAQIARDAA